ncbi:MAG: type II toxin-antitoxin system mRNA interferase toxin, RelE/StbE family [Thermodesulfobacteriota bacterium]|nr:type II toxin-antitoxin system mRNA interferase toxin, RelE/StbE family [Thermodesulfobacteriota bacterium]
MGVVNIAEGRLSQPFQLSIPEPLPAGFKDHKLKGAWHDFRECPIEPDWL